MDVSAGSWEGGYELERQSGGWVLVSGISCGDPLDCSDLEQTNSADAYYATLCFEQTD